MTERPGVGRWVARLGGDGPRERTLFTSSLVVVGEFVCDEGGLGWNHDARTGPWHLVVFPGPSVVIRQEGRSAVVANRNTAVLYEPGQGYRREPLEGRGDHCIPVGAPTGVLAEIAAEAGFRASDQEGFTFPSAIGPVGPEAFLLQRRIARYLLDEATPDPLLLEEASLKVLGSVVKRAFEVHDRRRRPPRRARTRAGHERAVADAAAFLTKRFAEPTPLAEVARAVHVSPFHLARVFRAETGYTLHAYRHHLRLRHAAERLFADRLDLVQVAAETGFASHAHLTDSFRRAFGRPPSAIRSANAVAEVRRILEAALGPDA